MGGTGCFSKALYGGKGGLCQALQHKPGAHECNGNYVAEGRNTAWGVLRYGRTQGRAEEFKV